jgi:hypothetical protein
MFQHVRDSARRLAERVGLVDDHPDLAGFEEPDERIQVFRFTAGDTSFTVVEPSPISTVRALAVTHSGVLGPCDDEAEFAFALDFILGGLDRLQSG